jgi:hypothetical protein
LTRRPTLAQTALRADQQMKLHDLLTTALMPQQFGDGAFRQVVVRQADAVCAQRSPSELIVRRLTGRAWSAIGLACSLVLTISMMSGGSGVSSAHMPQNDGAQMPPPVSLLARDTQRAPESVRVGARDADNTSRSGVRGRGASTEESQASTENSGRGAKDVASTPRPGSSNQSIHENSDGGIASETNDANVAPLEKRIGGSTGNPDGQLSNGAGKGRSSVTNVAGRDEQPDLSGQVAGAALDDRTAWQFQAWNAGRDIANAEMTSGHIPDAYREMVRDYFDGSKP